MSIEKERLYATCRRFGVEWVEDESNKDQRFDRVRVRRGLERWEEEQEGAMAMISVMQRIVNEAYDDVEKRVKDVIRQWAYIEEPYGIGHVRAGVMEEAEEVMIAVLSRVIAVVAGSAVLPVHGVIEGMVREMKRGGKRTLQAFGCVVKFEAEGLRVSKATSHLGRRVEVKLSGGQEERVEWDGRFELHIWGPHRGDRAEDRQWDYWVRGLRPDEDLKGEWNVRDAKEKGIVSTDVKPYHLQNNLPVLVRRRRAAGGEAEEELVMLPHLPSLNTSAHGGWKVRVERLPSAAAIWEWDDGD